MAASFPDHTLANLAALEEMYSRFLSNPESLEPSWRTFFEGMDFGAYLQRRETASKGDLSGCADLRIFELVCAYRRYGHLLAPVNPIALSKDAATDCADSSRECEKYRLDPERLGFSKDELEKTFPTLGFCNADKAPLQEIINALKQVYCSRIGFEYMTSDKVELQAWIQKKIEPQLIVEPTMEEKYLILDALNKSESLERYLHTKYVGQKRFSLEGIETIIPMLAEMIDEGIEGGISEYYIGMSHRGRLNVLANILDKPLSVIFKEFEDTFYPESMSDSGGDVKYHKGFSTKIKNRASLHLTPNASHLESVDAIVLGQTRAAQVQAGHGFKGAVAFLLHGDAAFAGQGVVYETMQLVQLDGYATGGTIHVVLNNQIGFTTLPQEARSTRYCTDLAKAFNAPIFHLNAEDPESCIYAAKMAMQIRQAFHCDIVLELNGYRKYGHNEGDEPFFTQPLHYKLIRSKQSIRELYLQQLLSQGQLEKQMAESLEQQFRATLEKEQMIAKETADVPEWQQPKQESLLTSVDTKVDLASLQLVCEKIHTIPDDFHLHPKLQKWAEERKKMMQSGLIDWGLGESLGFGTLLLEKTAVRLSGQDVQRGTFSHRHAVWIDQENGSTYFPLAHLQEGQGRFDALNSPLSEYSVLGFEFGYSWTAPEALVVWEAQFGDFANTAQVVIDQYISSAEQKWQRNSSLVLLLPHGMEGQGPEHSSGRIERFLQLCSNENMQLVNATSSAQFFHVLRRQVKRKVKKPLVVFTPKSYLRSAETASPMSAFVNGRFEEILDDPTAPAKVSKLLFCSGKVYFDLVKKRTPDCAILRIEQIFPLHVERLKELIAKYSSATSAVWVQEEQENMGAWEFIRPLLEKILPAKIPLRYAGRGRSSSPATGSLRRHNQELHDFLEEAFL